jgi:hypothetical protein
MVGRELHKERMGETGDENWIKVLLWESRT